MGDIMLIKQSEFIGMEGITHLCAGGETPMFKSHMNAVDRFFRDKLLGEEGRNRLEAVSLRCKEKVAKLFHVERDDIAFLSSTSEGINLLVHAIEWQPGDNIVVSDVEFPSDVLPWTKLKDRGVELRIVSSENWQTDLEALSLAMDDRTRIVALSYVSYFTGQRLPLKELSELVHNKGALLSLDVTHAAGVVPVEASYADIVVSSCYKWLMGVHGVGIFYWNRKRLPDLQPPFLGWHTPASMPDPKDPSIFIPRDDASRFTPGNETYIGVYILDNALDEMNKIGIPQIESHVLPLSTRIWDGLTEMGWDVITPELPQERAGNVSFLAEDVNAVTSALADEQVLIFGAYGGVGRARVSAHFYNSNDDVDRFFEVMKSIPVSRPIQSSIRDYSKAINVADTNGS